MVSHLPSYMETLGNKLVSSFCSCPYAHIWDFGSKGTFQRYTGFVLYLNSTVSSTAGRTLTLTLPQPKQKEDLVDSQMLVRISIVVFLLVQKKQ